LKYDGNLVKVYLHKDGNQCKVKIKDNIVLKTEDSVKYCEVDHRERESNIHNYMDNFVENVVVKTLEVSDIYFPVDKIGIERKTIPDLDNSMQSGRLEDQIKRGSKEFDIFLVIISGSIREYAYKISDNTKRDVMTIRKSLSSYIASLQAKTLFWYKNVRFMRVESDIELAHYASRFDHSFEKVKKEFEQSNGRWISEKPPIQDSLMPISFNQLRCHPKIGKKKSIKILEEFGNYKNFIESSTDEKVDRTGFSRRFVEEMERDINDEW
jgi:ERCC4-type nuclease